MSLPTNINLPLRINYQDEADINRYLADLVYELQNMYENIVDNVNGFIRNEAEVDQAKWTPTLAGTGGGSFTYTSQYGWSVRQGIYTELFADVSWSATTATGNLYLELPYRVTITNGMPFVGIIQPSNVTFAGSNLVINAISNTYRGEIWSIGSGIATTNLTVPASGRLIIHLRYIGLEDE